MAKTPFEVRLDLIKIAQEQVNQKYYSERDILVSRKQDPSSIEFPSFEKILEEAYKLKHFVDSN